MQKVYRAGDRAHFRREGDMVQITNLEKAYGNFQKHLIDNINPFPHGNADF